MSRDRKLAWSGSEVDARQERQSTVAHRWRHFHRTVASTSGPTPEKRRRATAADAAARVKRSRGSSLDKDAGRWQRWNRVTGSAILTWSGRVTGQCVRLGVWPGFEF